VPVALAQKPQLVDPPGESEPLNETGVAVTVEPDWLTVKFQSWYIVD
jgi:hypothetical protein